MGRDVRVVRRRSLHDACKGSEWMERWEMVEVGKWCERGRRQ